MKIHRPFIGLCLVALLSACGSGGGGGGGTAAPSGPVASTLSFPLKSAYSSMIANGATRTATISGTCIGTATLTKGPAIGGATFELIAGLSSASTQTTILTNVTDPRCPASSTQTITEYYDTNYVPLGFNASGGNYGVFQAPLPVIPTLVAVGNTGTLGTENLYTDNTKLVPAGTQDLTYVIEADTASTAIVDFILRSYNTSHGLTATQHSRYRIAVTGPLIPVSFDAVANAIITNLVYQ